MPTFGSLFAGIGGIDLGLERAGWTGRWQVEWDDWCRARLADRWPELTRYGDITDVDFGRVEPVDLLAGGFPCQPVSAAGRQKAQEDARWLWPEFHRAIRDLRPGLILVENVPNLLAVNDGSAFGDILGDLAASGYDTEWDCIPAAAVGAPHERDRVFLVAYPGRGSVRSDSRRGQAHGPSRAAEGQEDQRQRSGHPIGGGSSALAHADRSRLEGRVFHPERGSKWFAGPSGVADAPSWGRQRRRAAPRSEGRPLDLSAGSGEGLGDTDSTRANALASTGGSRGSAGEPSRRFAEPRLGGVADGFPHGLDHCWPAPPGPQYDWEPPRTVSGRVPNRVQRLKACGNAVVPQVVELIGRWLMIAERAA